MEQKKQSVVRAGVATFLLNTQNQILIGKRVKEQQFALPGGHLEMFESFEQCAARELKEETNVEIDPKEFKFVTVKNVINEPEERHYVDLVMIARMPENQVVINTEIDKCEGWKWISCDELFQIDKKLIFDALFEFIGGFKNGTEMTEFLSKII